MMKITLKIIALVCIAGITSAACKKQIIVPDSTTCDLSTASATHEEAYNFEADYSSKFEQSSRWESHNATIALKNGAGELTANSSDTKQALEAWQLFNSQAPYDRSWELSAQVKVPVYWNSNGGKKAQVGIGLFVGLPVASGQSSKVYECNFAAINGKERFVQAQLIANRLGQDPIDVQHTVMDKNTETVRLTIQYCQTYHSLSLFVDGKQVGKSKAIDASGADNWGLTDDGKMDIGIMGFAEKTTITAHSPTIDDLQFTIY